MTDPKGFTPAKNPRGWRWQKEVEPGVWVVACRACPKRARMRRTFATSGEATAWWREHQATGGHKRSIDVETLRRYRDESARLAAIFGVEPTPTITDAATLRPRKEPS